MPALGLSLFLIAVGAILAFAVTASVGGVSLYMVGIILLIVGAIGALFALIFTVMAGPRDGDTDLRMHS